MMQIKRITMVGAALLLACPVLPIAAQSKSAGSSIVHVVRRGETLTGISRRYGVSIESLRSANRIGAAGRIRIGQRLVVRGAAGTTSATPRTAVHVVRKGETLSGLARRYSISLGALRQMNALGNSSTIKVGQRLRVPAAGGGTAATASGGIVHVVTRGESLSKIARKYGVSVQVLRSLNSLNSRGVIYVGQKLVIRRSVSPGAGTPIPPPPEGAYIVIDAGHGGPVLRGTRGKTWPVGHYEADVTFSVANKVKSILENEGYAIHLTRLKTEDGPTLEARANACRGSCQLFVSLHVNAMPKDPHPSHGLEAYIPTNTKLREQSRVVAERIARAVSEATGQPILRINPRNLAVLRRANRPAVLFEMGFATHPVEGPWLLGDDAHETLARSIAAAIRETVVPPVKLATATDSPSAGQAQD